jgi:MFS family permease
VKDITAPPGEQGTARTASVTAVVGVLVLFELMSGFSQMGITPLLPDLADAYDLDHSAVNWVHSVFLLAATVSLPLFGRLGDLYGHRRMLRLALVSVAAGSWLVALAPDPALLWTGRALQGPIAALLPLEIALVRSRLSVTDARRAIARLVGALTLGSLMGAALMGAASGALGGVRTALLVPAVLATLSVPLSFVAVPESEPQPGQRVDWGGFALLALGATVLLAGVSAIEEDGGVGPRVLGALTAGLVLLAWWVRVELRSDDPLVDIRAMASRRAGPFYVCAACFGVVYFASQAPDTTFLAADPDTAGYGFGLSSARISLLLLPAILAAIVGSAVTVPLARRIGYRKALAWAFGCVAVSFAILAVRHVSLMEITATKVLAGLGLGIALSAMPTVVVEAADESRSGVAAAVYNNVKSFGGSFAGGVIAALMTALPHATGRDSDTPGENSYVLVWLLCALCAAGAATAAMLAHRPEEGGSLTPLGGAKPAQRGRL